MDWYIDSTIIDSRYLSVVESTVGDIMNFFVKRLDEVDIDFNILDKEFEKILNELPFMKFHNDKNGNFWFEYNRYTDIKFIDTMKSVKRDLVLDKILKN